MSKTKELLEGLNQITAKPSVPDPIYTSVSNQYGEKADGKPIYIDRLYGGLYGDTKVINKDHTTYKGKIHKRRRLLSKKDIHGESYSFYSVCYETADGRWFDNAGLPIDAPKKLEPEKKKTQEEIEEEQQQKADIAKRKEAAILANLK